MVVNSIQFTKIEIQIAKYLFKHYKDRYNSRQLAKVLNLNHTHINKLCNVLTGKKLLVKEKIGNSFLFSYNYGYSLAVNFIEYVLSLEMDEFPKWLDVLLHSLKKFKSHIEMGLVFGSSINNKNFNDVDILLLYSSKKLDEVTKIKDEIRKSELVEKPIRYVDITMKDIMLNKGNEIFYNMLSNNIVFYNPEKYVEVILKCRK
ncbi:MAG: hypothetical protein AABX96_05215 [Nanoarchaeota archaeon]